MHQQPPQDPDTPDLPDQGLKHLQRFFIGAAAGAVLPVLAGFYFVYQFAAYTATLPPGGLLFKNWSNCYEGS